jgi:hypothetical protein
MGRNLAVRLLRRLRPAAEVVAQLVGSKVAGREPGPQCRLVFGNNMLIPRNRAGGGTAKVDHIAYTVTNWDAEKDGLEEELKRRGLQYTGSAKTSFHVSGLIAECDPLVFGLELAHQLGCRGSGVLDLAEKANLTAPAGLRNGHRITQRDRP